MKFLENGACNPLRDIVPQMLAEQELFRCPQTLRFEPK